MVCSSITSFILAGGLTHEYRKKPAKNAKTIRDDNSKELFENGEWARNGSFSDIAMMLLCGLFLKRR